MVRDQAKLEKSIKEQFPLVFSTEDNVDFKTYIEKRNAATDFFIAASAAPLSTETIRYQSILLYCSLIFISFGYLNVSAFRLGGATIALDDRVFLFYIAFLVGVGLIFGTKAYIDYRRSHFSRTKNGEVLHDLSEFMALGRLRETVERHFYNEIYSLIGSAYRVYHNKIHEVRRIEPGKLIEISFPPLDLEAVRKAPDMAEFVGRHERFLEQTKTEIDLDVNNFTGKAEALLGARDAVPEDPFLSAVMADNEAWKSIRTTMADHEAWGSIRKLYDDTIGPWTEARVNLSSASLSSAFERSELSLHHGKLVALLNDHKRVRRLHRLYVLLEIAMPIVFALTAIAFVSFHVHRHGLPKPALELSSIYSARGQMELGPCTGSVVA